MKKTLSITLIAALSLVLFTGCSSKSETKPTVATPPPAKLDAKVSTEALFVKSHDNKKVLNVIKKAADKSGWNITEFKSNEVIAEKTANGNTIFSTIKFYDGHIEFSNNKATMDLREAIETECKSHASTH